MHLTNATSLPALLSPSQLKNWGRVMTVLLLMMLGGYFTVSESIVITQGVKVMLRLSATMGILLVYLRLRQTGHVFSLHLQFLLPVLFYCGYLLFGFVSFFWSTKVSYSALQWTMDVQSLVFAILFMRVYALMRNWYPEQAWSFGKMMSRAIFVISAIFLAGMFLVPDQFYRMTHGGEVARLGGNLMNPNELGMLSAMGAALMLQEIQHGPKRFRAIFMAGLMLLVVLATGSRSSLICVFIVGLWYVFTRGTVMQKAISIIVLIVATPLAINFIIIKQGDVGEVMSMTGRLPFWSALLSEGLPESPVFGFGFMRIAWTDTFQSVHTYAGHMTHNTFIQVLMNLGVTGAFFCFFSMATLFRARRKNRKSSDAVAFTAILIPVLVNSMTEFGIFGETNFDILIYQLLLMLFCFRINPRFTVREKLRVRLAVARLEKQTALKGLSKSPGLSRIGTPVPH
ncbi:MAG: O-antigen ligase family protein [Bacteroidota bacterium]